jgi:hypothetical protein
MSTHILSLNFASPETTIAVEANVGEVHFEPFFAVGVLRINGAGRTIALSSKVGRRIYAGDVSNDTTLLTPSVDFDHGAIRLTHPSLHAAAAITKFALKMVLLSLDSFGVSKVLLCT